MRSHASGRGTQRWRRLTSVRRGLYALGAVLLGSVALMAGGCGETSTATSTPTVEVSTSSIIKPYMSDPVLYRTKHLPKGTRIKVVKGRSGKRELSYTVEALNGVTTTPSPPTEQIVAFSKPPAVWVGQGKRGTATVTNVAIGTKEARATATVANPTKTVNGKRGDLAVSARLVTPRVGTKIRFVLLDPNGHEGVSTGDKVTTAGTAWYNFSTSWSWPSGTAITPTGRWVLVVEVDGRPTAWRVFTVK